MAAHDIVPRSRITLTYDTRQPDQPRKEKELPLRLLVMGDLTGRAHRAALGAAVPKGEYEGRPIHDLDGRNLDAVMEKLDISVELRSVTNHVDRDGAPFDVSLPIRAMASFEPGRIVQQIPATQRLLGIRKLLVELQASIDNNKQLRRLVRTLTSPGQAALLEQLRAKFVEQLGAQLRIATAAELGDGAPGDGAAGSPKPPTDGAATPPRAAPAAP